MIARPADNPDIGNPPRPDVSGDPSRELPSDLLRWVEQQTGAPIRSAHRSLSGGSRTTWLIDTAQADIAQTEPASGVVLRVENGNGAFAGTELTFAREAVLYRALRETTLPIPELLALSEDGQALLISRAAGRADLSRDSDQVRHDALRGYVELLARLHELDVSTLSLPGYQVPVDARSHAENEVQLWYRIACRWGSLDPELAFAFAWLTANAPEQVAGTSLLHGDAGPGNFVVDDGEVTALIDWEFAHIGDPVDDLAWLEFRSRRAGEPAGVARAMIEHYVAVSGRSVDPSSLNYYAVLVGVRCAVTAALSIASGGPLGRGAYRRAHRRLLRDVMIQLAVIEGVEIDAPVFPTLPPGLEPDCFDDALESVAGMLSVTRGLAKLHALWLQDTLRFLRNRDLFGTEIQLANDLEASAILAGSDHAPGDDRRDGRWDPVATAGGAVGDPTVLAVLARRAIRNDWLWSGEQPALPPNSTFDRAEETHGSH